MRVLFVIAHFDKGGGQAVQARQLIRSLRERLEGTVLALSADDPTPRFDPEDQIEILGGLNLPRGLAVLRKAISERRREFDLVQAFDPYYALPAARLARASPLVLRIGIDPIADLGARFGTAGRIWMETLGPWLYHNTSVIVNAGHLTDRFPGQAVTFIPNGVDPSRFEANPASLAARSELGLSVEGPLAAFTGKIVPRKNIEDLCWLLVQVPDLHLLLVGNRAEPLYGDRYYRSLLERFPSVVDRMHSVGEIPWHRIPRFLETADLFLFPSRLEGMPNSILEAMAASLPVVASNLPAHREIVPPGTGLLYRDRAELLRSVQQLLNEPQLRRQMGQRGREHVVANFSFSAAARSYFELYARLIAQAG
ncbi:MAG: glycosyltransferase family 4 protein [Thermoplasmata archaeon]|nr:glycosyltransferase family 4 protein [Thermoplasmata archaeon]